MAQKFGHIDSVIIGQVFQTREALANAGLHRSHQRGIDGNGNEGASAIVMSGGYVDDYDLGDEILYTGEGGNDPATGKQVGHQNIESPGNSGLIKSMRDKLPVRVIRSSRHESDFSPKTGYRYDGLYYVEDYELTTGKDGFKIIRFTLRKPQELIVKPHSIVKIEHMNAEGNKKLSNYSIDIDPPKGFIAVKLKIDSNLTRSLLGKSVGETYEIGPTKGIIKSIIKYKS